MSDTLTDDHVSWTQQFTGVNIGQSADSGSSAAPSSNGEAQSADAPAAAPGGFFSSIGDAISGAAHAVGDAAEAVGGAVVDGAQAIGGAVVDGAQAVGGAVVDGATAVVHGAEAVGEGIVDGAQAVGGAVVDGAQAVGGAVVDGATAVAHGAEAVGEGIVDGAQAVGGAVVDGATAVAHGAEAVGEGIVDGAQAVGGAIVDGATAVAHGAEAVGEGIVDGAKAVGGAIVDGATAVAHGAEAVGEGIVDGAKAVGGAIVDGVTEVGEGIVDGVETIGGEIKDAAVALGQAVGLIDPPAPPTSIAPPVLGPEQQKRADAAKAKLPPEDQKKYEAMLDGAKSAKEKQYLQKGLSAGHSLSELQAFQSKIAGKDEKWMQDNLSLTGNSEGKGVKQQWSMSCNATTAEAVRGQMDPLYALKMHEDNPDITDADNDDPMKKNANLAADQKAQLESANPDGSSGGVARARNDPAQVSGRWNTDLLNKDSASTGMSFKNKKIGDDGLTTDQAVDDISSDVQKGMPVPIVIGDGGDAKFAHYVLVTATDKGPPRSFSIHDPANGTTEVRTEDELKNGKIDLAGQSKGGGWMKLSAYEKPTPVEVK